MIALFGDADVVTSGFSAVESCPQRLHVKRHRSPLLKGQELSKKLTFLCPKI